MMVRIMAVLLLAVSGAVQASGLDLGLGDKSASITLLTDSSSLGYGGADVGYGIFFNEDDDIIVNANFMVIGQPASAGRPMQFGVGAKIYIGNYDRDDLDIGAIAIGGQFRYVIPSSVAPMALSIEAYYAPGISSFADTDSLGELIFRYEFEVASSTRAYVGYRRLEVDFETVDNVELDDNFHIGIRVNFD